MLLDPWKKIVDVVEINQRRSLEESDQWLENVYRTYLALPSGMCVLQKVLISGPNKYANVLVPETFNHFVFLYSEKVQLL